ncbi:MAG: DciA family protein [Parasphingorhabdus sp.]
MAKKIDIDSEGKAKSVISSPRAKSLKARKFQKYQRPRGGPAKSISDLVPEIGRAAFRRYGFIQSSVVSRWPEIVGERYAAVSLPESIRFPRGEKEGGTLHLLVSGAHATLMQHITPEIVERVNRFFGYGAISQVRFRQGGIDAKKDNEKRPALPPSLKPAPIELGDSLRDIGDPELNRVLESLASAVASKESDVDNQMNVGIKVVGKIGGGNKPAIREQKD